MLLSQVEALFQRRGCLKWLIPGVFLAVFVWSPVIIMRNQDRDRLRPCTPEAPPECPPPGASPTPALVMAGGSSTILEFLHGLVHLLGSGEPPPARVGCYT